MLSVHSVVGRHPLVATSCTTLQVRHPIGLIQGQVDDIMDSSAYLVQGVYAVSMGNEYMSCEVCTGVPSCSLHLCVHHSVLSAFHVLAFSCHR